MHAYIYEVLISPKKRYFRSIEAHHAHHLAFLVRAVNINLSMTALYTLFCLFECAKIYQLASIYTIA